MVSLSHDENAAGVIAVMTCTCQTRISEQSHNLPVATIYLDCLVCPIDIVVCIPEKLYAWKSS